jgi:hypothetical protein
MSISVHVLSKGLSRMPIAYPLSRPRKGEKWNLGKKKRKEGMERRKNRIGEKNSRKKET